MFFFFLKCQLLFKNLVRMKLKIPGALKKMVYVMLELIHLGNTTYNTKKNCNNNLNYTIMVISKNISYTVMFDYLEK